MGASRIVVLVCALVVLLRPPAASADWLITPWLGFKAGGKTTLVDLDDGAGRRRLTFGGSAALLSGRGFGIEVDFGHTPRFFDRDDATRLATGSRVTTLMGNAIVAAPLRWTRESLRPYVAGGLGLMQARLDDSFLGFERTMLGMNAGGGFIGPLSADASVRFDLRHLRNVTGGGDGLTFGSTRLSFWRASVGVMLRY